MRRPNYAAAAVSVLDKNRNKKGWIARHSIGWALVYALLDLADAIRGHV